MKILSLFSITACLSTATLMADFSYQQNSKITGGAIAGAMRVAGAFSSKAREPMAATILVKGHRMAHLNADTAQIIDLDKETITSVNYAKKTYSVMTFEQMKQMMQEMADRMGQKTDDADVNFKANVRETGQSKVVGGLNAKEVILTMTMEGTDKKSGQQGAMNILSDMWLAPDIPGYAEVRDFHRLMATKIGWTPGQNFGAMMGRNGNGMGKGMADMAKEMAKLDGVPVLQVMTVNAQGTGDPAGQSGAGGARSENPRSENPPQNSDAASQSAAAEALGRLGRLGGFGGLGRKKKDADSNNQPTPSSQSQGNTNAASGALMEITTESSGFSSAPVDASKLEVPAGFKEVEPEMGRRGRR
jgi:carbon monoxide dehydrogenase subunit G